LKTRSSIPLSKNPKDTIIWFLSLESLLGPLENLDLTGIDWVIVGGESGQGARPMRPEWVTEIRDRCIANRVSFFFNQWGGTKTILVKERGYEIEKTGAFVGRVESAV
jgi:protein gp37